jgi:hypothetical protein
MPAGVALLDVLHMTSQSGRAAVTNRLEGLSLMRAEHMSPSFEKLLLISAENIGYFEPMFAHRFGGALLAD